MEIDDLFRRHFGVMRVRDVLAAGVSRGRLRGMVSAGRLVRVHHGVLAVPEATGSALAAAHATGGFATCITALRTHDVWVPARTDTHRLHLAYSRKQRSNWTRHSAPPAMKNRIILHGMADAVSARYPRTVTMAVPMHSVSDALLCAERCTTEAELFAMLESAVRAGVPLDDLQALEPFGGAKYRRALAGVTRYPRSDSGVESLVAHHLRRKRVGFAQQVQIGGYRVDFLVGNRLIIEVDGLAYHGDRRQFQVDRERDRFLHSRGYIVLRFTAHEVMWNWQDCENEIMSFVRRRAHRPPPIGDRSPF